MDSEPFDPFAEPSAELIAEMAPPARPTKQTSPEFTVVKMLYDLESVKLFGVPFMVLMELHHVHFRKRINPVPLGNKNLRAAGVGRHSKMRALVALRDAGFVTFVCVGKSCPLVSLLWLPAREHSKWENAST